MIILSLFTRSHLSKRLFILFFLLITVQLFSQNIDIRILRSVNSHEALPPDEFFRFISNSDAYIAFGTPIVMGTVGIIKHDDLLFRNACMTHYVNIKLIKNSIRNK